jgi:hypothetical protein
MKNRILTLALAIALCIGLAAPAFAAGEVLYQGKGYTITRTKVSGTYMQAIGEGFVAVVDENGNHSVINSDGTVVVPPKYDGIGLFSDGLASVSNVVDSGTSGDGGWIQMINGYINTSGALVLPLEYGDAAPFHEGFARVSKNGEWGFINKNGVALTPFEYDYAGDFSEGYAAVEKNGKWGFIDRTGNVAIACTYDDAGGFSEGLASVKKDGMWGYINTSGTLAIPFTWSDEDYMVDGGSGNVNHDGMFVRSAFRGGRALLMDNKTFKFGFIDTGGGVVVPFDYNDAATFHEGFAAVKKTIDNVQLWGYIDTQGNPITPFKYSDARDFSEGFAAVYRNSGVSGSDPEGGWIDKSGEIVIPLPIESAFVVGSFQGGLAMVRGSGPMGEGYVDTDGDIVMPFKEQQTVRSAFTAENNISVVSIGSDWYILEKSTASTTPSAIAAKPTSSSVLVNGKNVAFDAYNIANNNYFKLRDLAFILSGTEKQFEVGYDDATKAITLTSGKSYTAVGGEMASKGAGNKSASPTSSKIYLDGAEVAFTAYNIGGNNYFKLRDIGQAFDFGVDWDGARNTIVIDTSKGYTPE